VEYEKGAKLILWAANAHISTMPFSGCMGDYLRQKYGEDMVVIGLLSNRGFTESPENFDLKPLTNDSSLEATLAQAGLDIAIINLRSLPKGAVSKYFNSPRKTGPIACLFPSAYDAILFIESTVTAIQAKGGSLRETVERLPRPSNLDFEEIEDGRLKDWQVQSGQSKVEYKTTGSHEQAYKGATCGMIKRIPGKAFGEALGNIRQSLKADDFRGETIQFTAATRVTDGIGYLWLSIEGRNAPTIFQQQIITSDKWQKYSISAEVPQEAFRISYGLAYVGQGSAFIDDIAIEKSN
jgi:hypothetical protein